MCRAIFLDVDGVLNSEQHMIENYESGKSNIPDHMELQNDALICLKEIVDKTGAHIFISSTWRKHNSELNNLRKQLKKVGLYFAGVTPELRDKRRGDEIRALLEMHPEIKQFVILDDDSDMCEFTDTHLVKCPWKTGLGKSQVVEAINILTR